MSKLPSSAEEGSRFRILENFPGWGLCPFNQLGRRRSQDKVLTR